MDHIPENEPPEVTFLESAMRGAITQGASHIHIEAVDDDVAVRYRVGQEYREFVREPREISAVGR
jgi:type II secretory ATPase GspE/PulE/Tfp pilus assembly ATPase PilB-like protein